MESLKITSGGVGVEVDDKRNALVNEAVSFLLGDEFTLDKVRSQGGFRKEEGKPEVFHFDGKDMVEFHDLKANFNGEGFGPKVIVEVIYKKLY